VVYVAGASALLAFVAALAVLDSERAAEGANIITFPGVHWWAFVEGVTPTVERVTSARHPQFEARARCHPPA
jgi:hypothetical protein